MELKIAKIDSQKMLIIDGIKIPVSKLDIKSSDTGMTELDITIQFETSVFELSAMSVT